jgi:hypothetical protein
MALSVNSLRRKSLVAIGPTADKARFWPTTVCRLMTQQRYRLCIAAKVLMPVSALVKVLGGRSADYELLCCLHFEKGLGFKSIHATKGVD